MWTNPSSHEVRCSKRERRMLLDMEVDSCVRKKSWMIAFPPPVGPQRLPYLKRLTWFRELGLLSSFKPQITTQMRKGPLKTTKLSAAKGTLHGRFGIPKDLVGSKSLNPEDLGSLFRCVIISSPGMWVQMLQSSTMNVLSASWKGK